MKGLRIFTLVGMCLALLLMLTPDFALAQPTGRPTFEDGEHEILASTKRGLRGYAPDAVYEKGEYKSNRRTGNWIMYYPNGKIKSEITYTNGRKMGPYKIYNDQGVMIESGDWARNKLKGKFEMNYEDGTPRQRFNYDQQGLRQGMQEYFYEDGTPMIKIEFKDGKQHGVIERYWPTGELKMRGTYKDGVLDPSSVKNFEPKKPQVEEVKPPDPPKLPKVLYGDYDPNGFSTLYNSDKQPVQMGDFKSGRLYNGKVYNYDENGLLIDVDVYREGRWAGKAVRDDEDK